MSAIRAVAVVIPARDEEELIARCLASVAAAVSATEARWGSAAPRVLTVVVADRCQDATAEIATGFEGVDLLELDGANVGAARAAGIRYALAKLGSPPANTWIANTDADSAVPENWILAQLDIARRHGGVMVGTVRPDFADLSAAQRDAWLATHVSGHPNGHVHGANLGVRADLYLAAGGFAELEEHEDVRLVERLRELRARIVHSDAGEVMTSGRHRGRAPGGYSEYLATRLVPDGSMR
ncbi:MAG TPA: glycosyltransferase [Lacisediminihabitans sp.]|uniref:glycosyltransferase n=1 Tax=Lacisediminihabitans sp. TaxID=2787631 RepID=UPI002ED8D9A7